MSTPETRKQAPDPTTNQPQPQPHTHRVVVFTLPDDPHALRDVLVDKLSLHPTDAQIHVHSTPGLLPDRLSPQVAAELVSAIQELGVTAVAVPSEEIPDFTHAETVHHARCLDDGLEIIELHGRSEMVAWSELELVSIGYVPLEKARHSYDEATVVISAAPRAPHSILELTSMSGPEAWLIRSDPRHGFRIDHNLMNYEYLEDRMSGSATTNFRLFVQDVVERTRQVYLTPATRAFLQHGQMRHYSFRSSAELRDYTIFHLLLHQSQQPKANRESTPCPNQPSPPAIPDL